ncbi:hypothetical protein GCM10022219_01240 [Microbacterium oryzae]|uniref:Glycosyltransferase RgtA/B/C/D-like domain-containing protein n=1 Tax=Microbacterium oryzae TaxID=743009 RepID=A0A6I6E1A4_9MICO|nr:DUF6020 family protein [Microbacterium oryzae]QGU26320.1 hypothetical protein D7D94_00375 [Microbacterium oryzae]
MRVLIAAAGAFVATLALCAGTTPGSLSEVLDGGGLVALAAFAALAVGGWWAIGWLPTAIWRWAVPLGAVVALAELAGLSLLREEADLWLLRPSGWSVVHVLGTAYVSAVGLALVLHLADLHQGHPASSGGALARFAASLARPRPWRSLGILWGVIVLCRLPYLLAWWPGLIFFDTYRSLSYARGLGPWESYEPVGHSLLITAWNGVWQLLGLGDAAALAMAASVQVLTSSAAFAFMLWRVAAWGVGPRTWWALWAWIALLPVLSMSSITVVKDIPFMSAFIVFLVGIVEVSRAIARGDRAWWPWVLVLASGIATMVLRNNGVHVVLLGVALLVIPFRRQWKRALALFAGCVVAYALYAFPLAAALGVQPGPKTEAWSVPLQQIARIADDHHAELSDEDRAFVDSVFTAWSVDDVGEHYIPGFADPIKLDARTAWEERTTGEFLAGWARLVTEYPGSAVTATLANTVGYWAPGAPSYDGVVTASWNDVRGIHLDIPFSHSGADGDVAPAGGVPAFAERHGLLDEGYRAIPVVGLTLSPGVVTWIWIVALVVLWRRRAGLDAAFALPAAALMATFLAGPVSGGMRYALGFYATVPIVVAVAAVARRQGPLARPRVGA